MDRRSFLRTMGAAGLAATMPATAQGLSEGTQSDRGIEAGDWQLDWQRRIDERYRPPIASCELLATRSHVAFVPRVSSFHDYEEPPETLVGAMVDRETGERATLMGASRPGSTLVVDDRFVTIGEHTEDGMLNITPWRDEELGATIGTFDGRAGGPAETAGERLLVPTQEDLVAFDLSDRTVPWRAAAEGPVSGVAVEDDVVYATTSSGTVQALDLATGERLWRTDVEDAPALFGPAIGGEHLVAMDGEGGVAAVSLDGDVSWSATPDGVLESSDPPIAATGSVGSVAVSDSRCFASAVLTVGEATVTGVTAFDLTDGSERWTTEIGPLAPDLDTPQEADSVPFGLLGQPDVVEGLVWATGKRSVLALDPASGRRERAWTTPDPLQATPLLTENALYVLDRFRLSAIDRTAGPCELPPVETPTVRFENDHEGDTLFESEPALGTPDCETMVRLELWLEGTLLDVTGGSLGPERHADTHLERKVSERPSGVERATVKLRGADGTVVEEWSVPIDDYRDDPPEFQVRCPRIDYDPTSGGTRLSVTVDVVNSGFDSGYVATLERDGEILSRKTGDIDPTLTVGHSPPANACDENTNLTLDHVFTEQVPQQVTARVAPAGEAGTADSVVVDLSEQRPPMLYGRDLLLLGAGGLTALIGGTYWWRKRNREQYY